MFTPVIRFVQGGTKRAHFNASFFNQSSQILAISSSLFSGASNRSRWPNYHLTLASSFKLQYSAHARKPRPLELAMKARLSVRKLCTFTLSVAVLVTLWQFSAGVHAQKAGKAKNADPPAA